MACLAGNGAGIQVHVEDLSAYLAGRDRCDAGARIGELYPAYEDLAAPVGSTWTVSFPGDRMPGRQEDGQSGLGAAVPALSA